jgi:hypothetical protein
MNGQIRRRLTVVSLSMMTIGLMSPDSFGGFYDFVTSTSSTSSGPVNAEVLITTGNGTINLTLKNLQANPADVTQALSDLSFKLGGGYAGGASSLTSSSGLERTIAGDGRFVDGATASAGWLLSTSGATFTLDDLNGGAGPSHLIIGGPDGTGVYSGANGSIAGNKPHNPFLANSATFTIAAAGVTTDTTVTSATFSFGTTSGLNVTGASVIGFAAHLPNAVPEPSAIVSTSVGLGIAGLAGWRRRRRDG